MNNCCTIDRVRLHRGKMPVDLTFSYGKVASVDFTIVRLFAGSVEGTGEVIVESNDFLSRFLSSLIGRDAGGLDALLPQTENGRDRILCEAVSIALYDLVGRVSGLPLHVLLGGAADLRVPLMPCIFPEGPEEAGEKAEKFFSQGYRYLKTKLIGDLDEDTARIEAIRSVAPEGVVLQGDANEGYKTLAAAHRAVEQLGAAGLDIFEDPLAGDVSDYRALRESSSGARVMVDKLSRRTDDLAAVLRSGAADVIGIHPDQPGSLSRALLHVRLAQSFSVPVVVGGTGYTGVGTAAYQHLTAAATPGGPCGELGGFFDHGMPRSLVKKPLPMGGGFVRLPNTPGMGIELDENALAEFETDHAEWDG